MGYGVVENNFAKQWAIVSSEENIISSILSRSNHNASNIEEGHSCA